MVVCNRLFCFVAGHMQEEWNLRGGTPVWTLVVAASENSFVIAVANDS